MATIYIAKERLWSRSKETYTEAGEQVDVTGWKDGDIKTLLRVGAIRAEEVPDEQPAEDEG